MSRFPVVFLDIDGVLNTSKNYYEWDRAMRESGKRVSFHVAPDDSFVELLFDRQLVQNFNKITRVTDAKIVVSSTWRNLYQDLQVLVGILKRVGIEGEVIGKTPSYGRIGNGGRGERGDEVAAWREDNGHSGPFVCIDDDADFQAVKKHLVQTNGREGVTEEDADMAVKVLKKGSRK